MKNCSKELLNTVRTNTSNTSGTWTCTFSSEQILMTNVTMTPLSRGKDKVFGRGLELLCWLYNEKRRHAGRGRHPWAQNEIDFFERQTCRFPEALTLKKDTSNFVVKRDESHDMQNYIHCQHMDYFTHLHYSCFHSDRRLLFHQASESHDINMPLGPIKWDLQVVPKLRQ